MRVVYFFLGTFVALTVSTTLTFVAGPPSATTSSVSLTPATLFADGNSTTLVTVTVRDAYNNKVAASTVSLSASGGNNIFGQASGVSDANGIYKTTLASTLVQTENITANLGAGQNANAACTFIAGPASAATSTLAISPASQTADNNATIVASLTVTDAQSRPMANRTATFTSSGAAMTISTAAQTNASGITSATYKSTLAQNANILVAVDGLSFVAPIVFMPGPVASTKSTIVLTPNKVVADGMTQTSILVTSRDAQNNIDPNVAVSLTASGGNTTIANPSGMTNASGQYSTTMTSTLAQVETISAALNSNVTITASMTFVAGPAYTTFSTLTTARYQTLANNSNVVTASLYLADIYNNPISGQTPVWSISGTGMTTVASGATSSAGIATATFRTGTVQNANITANANGITEMTTARFVPNPNACVMTLDTNTQVADGNSPINISVFITDANQTAMSNQPVSFVVSGSTGPLASTALRTNASGYVSNTLKSFTKGPSLITARAGNTRCTAQVNFTQRASFCSGNPNYTASRLVTTSAVNSFAQGDMNNDGLIDVVTVNANNTLNVYLGTGSGTFGSAISMATTGTPTGLFLVDLNADGYLDAFYGDTTHTTIVTTLGNGSGGFTSTTSTVPTYGNVSATLISDFDGDGLADYVMNNYTARNVVISQGTDTGAFWPGITYSAYGCYGFTPTDVDSDGNMDFVCANRLSGTADIFRGSGLGNFVSRTQYVANGYTEGVTIGDFNNDGYQDAAVTNNHEATLGIFLSNGDGTFGPVANPNTGTSPLSISSGDLTGDGIIDLVVQANTKQLLIYPGTSSGTFSAYNTYTTTNNAGSIAISDLNRDSYQDLMFNTGGNGLDIWLYSSCR